MFKPIERTKFCQTGLQLIERVGHCAVESHCVVVVVALADGRGGGGEVAAVLEVAAVREI